MLPEKIRRIVATYRSDKIRIGVLGSHSALEMGYGAKQEGLEVVVVCQKGREKTYIKHYKNLFDHVLLVERFRDMAQKENQEKMREIILNVTVFINSLFEESLPKQEFKIPVAYTKINKK